MSVRIIDGIHGLPERQAVITDPDPAEDGTYNGIVIHPWDRPYRSGGESDRSVYLAVGYFRDTEGTDATEDDENPLSWNFIADRDEFVNAILEVLPELQRKETA